MKIVSLFSGAGGLDLGLIQAGHEIIWANDNDKDCELTYVKNVGEHFICDDIERINLDDIPNCDVVIGGFPCQGFSQANLLREKNDDRNKLYKHFLRTVSAKKPKYFLAENVRGILSLDEGKVIARIVSDFQELGYKVKYKLFNTADFGVPQTRMRVIISGTRIDLSSEFEYQYPEPTHGKQVNGNKIKSWVSIGQALRGIPEPNDETPLLNHIYSKYKVTNRNFTGHRKTDPHKPSPTILARGNGKGGVCAIQHPMNHRRMSVRESATVQTFPLSFEFFGKMGSMYRQVGNAVPVLFAKCLGEQLKKCEKV
jgi:DNA (cytosine-5)-methyltransferase 1